MSYTDLLKAIWDAVYDLDKDFDGVYAQYFHDEYSQCINGIELNRDEYQDHALVQRQLMQVHAIDYKHIVEQGNALFALYYPKGVNIDGQPLNAEVIVYCQFEDQQLLRIHGQVRLIDGDAADVDMTE